MYSSCSAAAAICNVVSPTLAIVAIGFRLQRDIVGIERRHVVMVLEDFDRVIMIREIGCEFACHQA